MSNIHTPIGTLTGVTCHFRVQEVLFGIVKRNYCSDSLDVLLLLLKYYIFKASRLDKVFNIPSFLCKIKQNTESKNFWQRCIHHNINLIKIVTHQTSNSDWKCIGIEGTKKCLFIEIPIRIDNVKVWEKSTLNTVIV